MKKCNTLEEAREEIDKLDTQIVELIAKRNEYIKQIAHFKNTIDEIKEQERIDKVISKVRMKHGVPARILPKALIRCQLPLRRGVMPRSIWWPRSDAPRALVNALAAFWMPERPLAASFCKLLPRASSSAWKADRNSSPLQSRSYLFSMKDTSHGSPSVKGCRFFMLRPN